MEKANRLHALSSIGLWSLTEAQKNTCIEFVGLIYDQPNCTFLNKLHEEMAEETNKKKKKPS